MFIEEKELEIVQATCDWVKYLQDYRLQVEALEQNLKKNLLTNEETLGRNLGVISQNLSSQLQNEKRLADADSSRLFSSKNERLNSLNNAIAQNQNQITANKRRLSQLQTDMASYISKVEKALHDNIDAERQKIAKYDAEVINEIVKNYTYYRGKAGDYTPKSEVGEDMIYTWDNSTGKRLRVASNGTMVGWLLIVSTAIMINIISGVANPIGKVLFNPFILILLGIVIIVWVAYLMQYKGKVNKLQKDRQSIHNTYESKEQEMRRGIQHWFKERPYYLPKGSSAEFYMPMGTCDFSHFVVPYKKVNVNEQLNKAIQSCRSYKPVEIGNDFTFELDPTFKSLFN